MPIGGGGGGGASSSSSLGFVGAKAWNSAVQSINSGANTAVTFDSEEFDTSNFHSTSANTSRMTVPTGLAGYYLCTFSSFWSASPGTGGRVGFQKNGTTLLRSGPGTAQSASVYTPTTALIVQLAAADYVEAIAFQNSGGAVNLGHATVLDAQSSFAFVLLGV